MSKSVEDLFTGAGAKSANWDVKGTIHKGEILSIEVVQARDIKDGSPKVWNDGSPVEQIRIILQTEERDPQDDSDDGQRSVYLKGGKAAKDGACTSLEAVKLACKAVGVRFPEVGGTLGLQYVVEGERSNPGYNPPKLFKASYALPKPAAVDLNGLM